MPLGGGGGGIIECIIYVRADTQRAKPYKYANFNHIKILNVRRLDHAWKIA